MTLFMNSNLLDSLTRENTLDFIAHQTLI